MSNRSSKVEDFMTKTSHPMGEEIELLRTAILESDSEITEQIKWNAPSFCINGEDRVTFRFISDSEIQLIFHRGAKVKPLDSFTFEDPTGLMKWAAPDRSVVTISDAASQKQDIVDIVTRWMAATR